MILHTMSGFRFVLMVIAYLGWISILVAGIIMLVLKADKELEGKYGE